MTPATAYCEALPIATEQSRKPRYATSVPSLFSVVSWGCAGTAWLARALNSHPELSCAHGMNHYWHSMLGHPAVDGLDYLNVLAAHGVGFQAIGDVHGISRDQLPAIKQFYGKQFSSAVLVREPLARVHSQIKLSLDLSSARHWDRAHLHHIAHKAQLDPLAQLEGDWVRLHAYEMLNAVVDETQTGPIYRIEDLGSQSAALESLLAHLTADRISAPGWWLDFVDGLPRLNGHVAPADHGLDSFDLKILGRVLCPEAAHIYRRLGYELDFCP